jgi:hypothetical protein
LSTKTEVFSFKEKKMAKKEEVTYGTTTLVLDNGDEIMLIVPDNIYERVWEEIMAKPAWWYCGNWDGMTIDFKGSHLEFINMDRVVGIR